MTLVENQEKAEEIIHESARLRAKRAFNEAIDLIENNIADMQPASRALAWMEAFNAARAKGDTEQAKRFILEIHAADPGALSYQ